MCILDDFDLESDYDVHQACQTRTRLREVRVLDACFSTLVPWSNVDESWLKLEFKQLLTITMNLTLTTWWSREQNISSKFEPARTVLYENR